MMSLLTRPSGLISSPGRPGRARRPRSIAAYSIFNDGTRKINTIEDPIEYVLEGVRQSQVNQKSGSDSPNSCPASSASRPT